MRKLAPFIPAIGLAITVGISQYTIYQKDQHHQRIVAMKDSVIAILDSTISLQGGTISHQRQHINALNKTIDLRNDLIKRYEAMVQSQIQTLQRVNHAQTIYLRSAAHRSN